MSRFVSEDQIDFVLAFEQALPRRRVDREGLAQPEPIAHFAALEVDLDAVVRLRARRDRGSASTAASGSATGSMPLPIALLRKMSANDGAMTTRKPASCSAQAACSRDEPQPKFTPATSTEAPSYCCLVQHERRPSRFQS